MGRRIGLRRSILLIGLSGGNAFALLVQLDSSGHTHSCMRATWFVRHPEANPDSRRSTPQLRTLSCARQFASVTLRDPSGAPFARSKRDPNLAGSGSGSCWLSRSSAPPLFFLLLYFAYPTCHKPRCLICVSASGPICTFFLILLCMPCSVASGVTLD